MLLGTFGKFTASTSTLSTVAVAVLSSPFGHQSDADAGRKRRQWRRSRKNELRSTWRKQFKLDTLSKPDGQPGTVIFFAAQFFGVGFVVDL